MRTGLLEFLCCPSCKAALELVDDVSSGRTVVSGALRCGACGECCPIRQGVPDVVRTVGACARRAIAPERAHTLWGRVESNLAT